MVSKARLLLPEPDKPVMTISRSRGIETVTFLRLCSRAPRTTSCSCGIGPHYRRNGLKRTGVRYGRTTVRASGATGRLDYLRAITKPEEIAHSGFGVSQYPADPRMIEAN